MTMKRGLRLIVLTGGLAGCTSLVNFEPKQKPNPEEGILFFNVRYVRPPEKPGGPQKEEQIGSFYSDRMGPHVVKDGIFIKLIRKEKELTARPRNPLVLQVPPGPVVFHSIKTSGYYETGNYRYFLNYTGFFNVEANVEPGKLNYGGDIVITESPYSCEVKDAMPLAEVKKNLQYSHGESVAGLEVVKSIGHCVNDDE